MSARIRRALRFVLCAWVVLGLIPGAAELLENVAHLVHDGHLPHGVAHTLAADDEACGEDQEHGCTPLAHQCPCCVSIPAVPQTPEPPSERLASAAPNVAPPRSSPALLSRSLVPPVPPPIA